MLNSKISETELERLRKHALGLDVEGLRQRIRDLEEAILASVDYDTRNQKGRDEWHPATDFLYSILQREQPDKQCLDVVGCVRRDWR